MESDENIGEHLEGVQRHLLGLGLHLRSIKVQHDGGGNTEKQTLCLTASSHKPRRLPGKKRVVSTKMRKDTKSNPQRGINVKLINNNFYFTNSPVNLGYSSGNKFCYGSCECKKQEMEYRLQLEANLNVLEYAVFTFVNFRANIASTFRELASDLHEPEGGLKRVLKQMATTPKGVVCWVLALKMGASTKFLSREPFNLATFYSNSLGGLVGDVAMRILEPKTDALRPVLTWFERDRELCDNLKAAQEKVDKTAFQAGKTSCQTVSGVVSPGRARLGATADEALSLPAVPLDLNTVISSAAKIDAKTVTELTQGIQQLAAELECPVKDEMCLRLSMLRNELHM